MRAAVDFSFARPTVEDLVKAEVDVLCYTGPARPDKDYLDALRANGIAVTLIQESDPNRSQRGYAAGVSDARFADQRADDVGYPRSSSIAYAVSDGSAGDPNYGAERIAEYTRGVAETSLRPVFWYGNQYACDAAMSGAPRSLGTWIPSTWGTGSLLTQEANTASPIGDTDLNTVHAPYGAWGHADPAPVNPWQKWDVMDEFFATDPATRQQVWWFGEAGRRWIDPDTWGIIQFQAAARGLGPIKPFAGTQQMFDRTPDVTSYAGGAGSSGPLALSGTFIGKAA